MSNQLNLLIAHFAYIITVEATVVGSHNLHNLH